MISNVIMEELRSFSEDLANKPMIVVASKTDACQDDVFGHFERVSGKGIEDLRFLLRDRLFKPEPTVTL